MFIPPQTDGLVGCGDLCFQQKMSDLSGVWKAKRFLCTYCKTESDDHDLLYYVSGNNFCAMCVHNVRDGYAHRPFNDGPELYSRSIRFLKLLLDDNIRRSVKNGATYQDMLPSEPPG